VSESIYPRTGAFLMLLYNQMSILYTDTSVSLSSFLIAALLLFLF